MTGQGVCRDNIERERILTETVTFKYFLKHFLVVSEDIKTINICVGPVASKRNNDEDREKEVEQSKDDSSSLDTTAATLPHGGLSVRMIVYQHYYILTCTIS